MKHKANLSGTDDLIGQLKFLGLNIFEAGERAVAEAIDRVKDESVKRSPVDTHDLEKCHSTKVHSFKNIHKIVGTVFIDDSKSKAPHATLPSEYALIMHEHLAPYGSGAFKLGPKSRIKSGSEDVGGKFMFRALEDNRDALNKSIAKSLASTLRGLK